jgi:hypothetical protein
VKGFPQVATFTFPVEQEKSSAKPMAGISFSFRTLTARKLPAGGASCYWQGEYMGETAFTGSLPGEVREMACGR